jgi:hypothetical protein
MQQEKTDEVARNGVLQRITSARGFLGHPLLKNSKVLKVFLKDLQGNPPPTPLADLFLF